MVKKRIKFVSLLSAAVLLAICTPMTSFADEGWVQEGDVWYYYDDSGSVISDSAIDVGPVTSQVKKFNGQYYVFDQFGIMKKGLCVLQKSSILESDNALDSTVGNRGWIDPEIYSADMIYDIGEDINLYYFSEDTVNSGSAVNSSSVKISLCDDDYTFGFDHTTHKAYDGVYNSKVYRNGILQSAGDDKYAVRQDSLGNLYVVGTSGTYVKAGKAVKDANDDYYAVVRCTITNHRGGDDTIIIKISGEDASKVASQIAKGETPDASYTNYTLEVITGGDSYTNSSIEEDQNQSESYSDNNQTDITGGSSQGSSGIEESGIPDEGSTDNNQEKLIDDNGSQEDPANEEEEIPSEMSGDDKQDESTDEDGSQGDLIVGEDQEDSVPSDNDQDNTSDENLTDNDQEEITDGDGSGENSENAEDNIPDESPADNTSESDGSAEVC